MTQQLKIKYSGSIDQASIYQMFNTFDVQYSELLDENKKQSRQIQLLTCQRDEALDQVEKLRARIKELELIMPKDKQSDAPEPALSEKAEDAAHEEAPKEEVKPEPEPASAPEKKPVES